MGEAGYADASVHMGAQAWAWCHTYPEEGPILALHTGGFSLTLTQSDRKCVNGDDVRIARQLIEVATTYLAEVERLHAAGAGQSETASPAA